MAANANCDPCQEQEKQTKGQNWCPNCDETLCSDCTTHHKSSKALKNHKLIDINLMSEVASDMCTQQYCNRHTHIQIEYFCSDHDAILCRGCLAVDHRSCKKVTAIDMAYTDKTSMLEDTRRETEHIVETLVTLRSELQKNSSALDGENDQIKLEIATEKSKAFDRLNSLERSLITQLRKTADKKKLTIQKKLREIEDLNNESEKHLKQIQFTEEHGTDKQAFLLAYKLRPFLKETEELVSQMTLNAKTYKLQYRGNKNVVSSITTLGNIAETENQTGVKYSPLSQKQAQVICEKQTPLETFQIGYRFDSICTNVTGMISTNDGNLLLCDSQTDNVVVYSENGKYIRTIHMAGKPFDIALIPCTNQYVVTLPVSFDIQFISNGMKPGRVIHLRSRDMTLGIAATNKNIYVGDLSKILVLNINGDQLKEIDIGKECGRVDYIITQVKNKLSVVDGHGSMFCISGNGEYRKYKKACNVFARKLVIDKQDYVYCAWQTTNQIHRFTPDMKPDKTIGDPSLNNFWAFCFNQNCSKLFVANESGKSIVAFNCT